MNALFKIKYFSKPSFQFIRFIRFDFCIKNNKGTTVNLENSLQLENIITKATNPVIVDFYADWCGPCKKLTPVLENKLKEKDFTLVKVNVDNYPELAEKYNVQGIPLVLLFKKGKKEMQFAGFNEKALNTMIDSI